MSYIESLYDRLWGHYFGFSDANYVFNDSFCIFSKEKTVLMKLLNICPHQSKNYPIWSKLSTPLDGL